MTDGRGERQQQPSNRPASVMEDRSLVRPCTDDEWLPKRRKNAVLMYSPRCHGRGAWYRINTDTLRPVSRCARELSLCIMRATLFVHSATPSY